MAVPLVPTTVDIVVDSLEDGIGRLKLGDELTAVWPGDDQAKVDQIRAKSRKVGTGVCDKQNRIVDLFFCEAENHLYALSLYRGDRWFDIRS